VSEILASITQNSPADWTLSGQWTARSLATMPQKLQTLHCGQGQIVLDGSNLNSIDSAGVWLLQRWLKRNKANASLRNWPPTLQKLMTLVSDSTHDALAPATKRSMIENIGKSAESIALQLFALLSFVGETAMAVARQVIHPQRIRWSIMMRNIQIGGFNALPIIGLTSFLLGVVVAYQGADQLKHYGANIFVVELIGYAMLREFAPLITAIIIAGRSGSAFAAAIGTMVITEEVDAMRTIDIDPIEFLVLPKMAALAIALPLLTVFADVTGVLGGMVMARSQLDISFQEFIDRFAREIPVATFLVGIGKSFVFAIIIAGIGCFQGFRTQGSADSVGRQTTTSVVQSAFLVIVADALFSVVFNMLDI
jgi:phospholipid/cholesterol/gamma-HCH transport system permease protein